MTFPHGGLRRVALAAAFVMSAAVASAQSAPAPPQHNHGIRPHAAPHVNVQARMALLDERIAMLTADMKMFAGELKIQAMAELIEALVERQRLGDREMRSMLEWMPHPMKDRVDEESMPAPLIEVDPEAMCSPFI
jgi:hypothetical protein